MPRITLTHDRHPLVQLAEQGAILAHEFAPDFNERHRGSTEVSVDLAATPEPVYTFHGLDITYRPQFLGSFSGIDDSFMWGWNNINGYPDAAVEVAQNLRSFGEQAGVLDFTTPVMKMADEAAINRLIFAAIRVTGNPAYHRIRTQHGHAYFMLYGFQQSPSQVVRVERAIMDAIGGGWVQDHVAALQAYLEMRPGVSAQGTAKGLVIHCSDGQLEIELDAQRRIATTRFTVDEQTAKGLRGE